MIDCEHCRQALIDPIVIMCIEQGEALLICKVIIAFSLLLNVGFAIVLGANCLF